MSPADGWISNFDLREGVIVEADEPVFSIVEDAKWWIQANFKETQMRNIRSGQPVKIKIDMKNLIKFDLSPIKKDKVIKIIM